MGSRPILHFPRRRSRPTALDRRRRRVCGRSGGGARPSRPSGPPPVHARPSPPQQPSRPRKLALTRTTQHFAGPGGHRVCRAGCLCPLAPAPVARQWPEVSDFVGHLCTGNRAQDEAETSRCPALAATAFVSSASDSPSLARAGYSESVLDNTQIYIWPAAGVLGPPGGGRTARLRPGSESCHVTRNDGNSCSESY